MAGRLHGGFRFSGINHDDLGISLVLQNALPENGMGNAEVRSDQHNHIRFFKISIGIGRRIETERLLVGPHRCRHTLPGVSITMDHSHPEFGEGTEQSHFLGADLPGTEKGDGFGSMRFHDLFHTVAKDTGGRRPIRFLRKPSPFFSNQGNRRPVGCFQGSESFPAFRTGHSGIHRIVHFRREVACLTVP